MFILANGKNNPGYMRHLTVDWAGYLDCTPASAIIWPLSLVTVRHKDVPPPARGQREPAKYQQIHVSAPVFRGRHQNRSG
jgi:hypothetical protein